VIVSAMQHWGTMLGGWLYLVAALAVFGEAAVLAGMVIPGESALLVAGLAAQQGWLKLPVMLLVAFAAAAMGDTVGYEVGRRWGPVIRRSRLGRRIGERNWQAVDDLLLRRGGTAVLAGRFTALLRALVPGMAGMSGMPYWRTFLPWNLAGAAVWAPGCVLLGYGFSASLDVVGHYLTYGPLVLVAGIAAVVVGTRLARRRRAASSPADSDGSGAATGTDGAAH
jgi:membrane-associated protein